jgi:thiosulfate/3-mercaptopyruvate sulfurtransferase
VPALPVPGAGMSDVELEELERRLGEAKVVDVRHPYEYDGSFGAPCDPRQGHIPGAVNVDVDELVTMSAEQVGELLDVEPGAEIVVYCHSGSRSARAAMILQRLGYEGRNYAGSWHEWSRTELPIET